MLQLSPEGSRVLGVLIEKAMTTPDQYPLSLNAVVNGANQKNNRDPVITMDEGTVFEALEGLRTSGLVIRSDMAGSRVNKYRHHAGEVLHARPAELALLAELLLRGPQTLGELRGRASRMQSFESLEAVKNMLGALMTRDEPMVKEIPPAPGSRAERYVQLLCPDLHPIDAAPPAQGSNAPSALASGGLAARVEALETELAAVKAAVRGLATALGERDPLA